MMNNEAVPRNDIDGAVEAVAILKAEAVRLDGEILRLTNEISDVGNDGLAREDVIANACTAIDRQAATYSALLSANLEKMSRTGRGGTKVLCVFRREPGVVDPQMMELALAAAIGPQIKTVIVEQAMSMPWPAAGLPIAERPAAIQRLTAELAEARRQRAELSSKASAAGMLL